jgi:ubiquinone/menaquinone biosynthesis C-methylase UbiE
MEQRRPFQGVLNILSFNRHFYVIGLAVLAAVVAYYVLAGLPAMLFWGIIAAFGYGLIMPLVVSAYVYDFSGYYGFDWLEEVVPHKERIHRMVNINAGFDETSFIIKNKFPKAQLQVFDFYNAERHTEAAIVRARKVSLVYPHTEVIQTNAIPMEDKSVDLLFLLSAAHEIRANEEKVAFLKECRRVCKADGQVIMVEHLRDFPNFVSFTVGFTHFFSRRVWKKAFKDAGFSSFGERKFTPFMSVFYCRP